MCLYFLIQPHFKCLRRNPNKNFVGILVEMTKKGHFEINWPLESSVVLTSRLLRIKQASGWTLVGFPNSLAELYHHCCPLWQINTYRSCWQVSGCPIGPKTVQTALTSPFPEKGKQNFHCDANNHAKVIILVVKSLES